MNKVTDAGRGAYVYLDSTGKRPTRRSARGFDEVMDISARAVQVSVTRPSYFLFNELERASRRTRRRCSRSTSPPVTR